MYIKVQGACWLTQYMQGCMVCGVVCGMKKKNVFFFLSLICNLKCDYILFFFKIQVCVCL